MKNKIIKSLQHFSFVIDIIYVPFIFFSGLIMKSWRHLGGICRLNISKNVLYAIGVFPIRDHYYEPMFNPKYLRYSLAEDRVLTGIKFNMNRQLELLKNFIFATELKSIPETKKDDGYYYNCESFGRGDSEILYSMIRYFKPKRIIEIGCGNSTLMAEQAICKNVEECSDYSCNHICIEPFEAKWLEKLSVTVIREKLEDVNLNLFLTLEENDILFIDSSHVIRPQGDVLAEYLELIPVLCKGVIVHIHDIFTPRDYRTDWILDKNRLWNEQYLLEAFLSFNDTFEVICSVNYLKHNHYLDLREACPMIREEDEPGSFWIRRIR